MNWPWQSIFEKQLLGTQTRYESLASHRESWPPQATFETIWRSFSRLWEIWCTSVVIARIGGSDFPGGPRATDHPRQKHVVFYQRPGPLKNVKASHMSECVLVKPLKHWLLKKNYARKPPQAQAQKKFVTTGASISVSGRLRFSNRLRSSTGWRSSNGLREDPIMTKN